MGCGSSNQVHDTSSPTPIGTKQQQKKQNKQQQSNLPDTKCYLFGQSSGERKVVLYNSTKQHISTLSSRIRIPIAKVKLEPIEILYEESQQVILPDLMKREPNPPFNHMFGTFCRPDVIFLCGGISYEGETVYSQSYFYNASQSNQSKPKSTISTSSTISNNRVYVKFEQVASMDKKRYSHMGLYYCDMQSKKQCVFVFGGKDSSHQPTEQCEKFDFLTRKWKMISSMYTPRAEGCAMLLLNRVYIFGGITSMRQYVQTIEVYDIKNDSWNMLNMRLHRGIRSCMIMSANPNEILIFGGITGIDHDQQKLNSVIKVNLIQQTYIWQTNLPEPISNLKHTHQKHKNTVTIFSNDNNILYSYNLETKKWKNLSIGYKSYIPVVDIKNFSCVTEPLSLKFQPINDEMEITEASKMDLDDVFIFGNESYPCSLNVCSEKDTYFMEIREMSMKLHLKSNMRVVSTKYGYYVCGGADSNHRHSSNQLFLYDPDAPVTKSVVELASMKQGRHSQGLAYINEHIYVFGGCKNKKQILKTCEKYSIKQNSWTNCANMIKSLYNLKTFVFKEIHNKVLIIGGNQENGDINTLIQIYDTEKDQIVTYSQFPALSQINPITIFVQILNDNQIKNLEISNAEKLLQISQFYSNRSSLEKQNLQNSGLNKSPSLKKTKAQELNNKIKNLPIKNLAAEHIPSLKKQNPPQKDPQKQKEESMLKIIEVKTQAIEIKPSKKQQTLNIDPILVTDNHHSIETQKSKLSMVNSVPIENPNSGSQEKGLAKDKEKQKQKEKEKEIGQEVGETSKPLEIIQARYQTNLGEENDQFLEFSNISQTQKSKFIGDTQNKNKQQQQPSSESLITQNKNAQKNLLINENFDIKTSGKDSFVLKLTQYGRQQNPQVYPYECKSKSVFYLLINKSTFEMSLVKDHQNSTVALKQPLKFCNSFVIDKPQYKNYHCFMDLEENMTENNQPSSSICLFDSKTSKVKRINIFNKFNNQLASQCSSFTMPDVFI